MRFLEGLNPSEITSPAGWQLSWIVSDGVFTAGKSWKQQRCWRHEATGARSHKLHLQPRTRWANYQFCASLTRWRSRGHRERTSSEFQEPRLGARGGTLGRTLEGHLQNTAKCDRNPKASCFKERLTRAARPHLFSSMTPHFVEGKALSEEDAELSASRGGRTIFQKSPDLM